MRGRLGLVCLTALSMSFACVSFVPLAESSTEATILNERLDGEREAKVLPPLSYDQVQSSIIERYGMDILRLYPAAAAGSVVRVNLDPYITDCHKVCFLVEAPSLAMVRRGLVDDTSFARALLDSTYTHAVVGVAADSLGGHVAIVAFVQRLISLDPFEATVVFEGPTYLTISGRAPDLGEIRVAFYKRDANGGEPDPRQRWSSEVLPISEGGFRVTLPMSIFGEGEYHIVLDARADTSSSFVCAHAFDFTVR